MIREHVDVVVLGAGFAGSLMAMIARRQGRRVALIERGTHPRFSLGESSTPLANLSLAEIARDYDLPWLAGLSKYGRWKKTHPELVCGLKRGFTFVKHHEGLPHAANADHGDELLVAASPEDDVADTHWLRTDFDAHLARQADDLGVLYLDRTEVERRPGRWPCHLVGRRGDEPVEVTGSFLIDATGPAGASAWDGRAGEIPPLRTSSWAVYSHFEGVERWEDVARDLGVRTDEHPYRCDDAALHHILDDGWIYVLRFDNGVTSAGVLIDGYRGRPDLSLTPEQEWLQFLERYPSVARQFERASPVRPFVRTGIMQRRRALPASEDTAVLASSAYTLDALYSTGIAHTLHTIQRLARLLERHWDGDLPPALARYNEALSREIDFVDMLVDGTYQTFRNFGVLASFSMYYFAGAITAEERRQQGRAIGDEEFLHSHDPAFRAAVERGYEALQPSPDIDAFRSFVSREIAPWNSVGLCDPSKRNLYPYG